MDDVQDAPVPEVDASTPFARALRRGVQARGLSLRAVQGRLRDRGYAISLATLSLWQAGARRPERGSSYDVLRELEEILRLDEGELEDALGPSRRVHAGRHVPYADQVGLAGHHLAAEPEPELVERSGTLGVYLDAQGGVTRTLNRTLWQARTAGARYAMVFANRGEWETELPDFRGTLGCDLVDMVVNDENTLVRATLRLTEALDQGDLALTERVRTYAAQTETEQEVAVIAPRRQAALILYVGFDPERLPSRCRATIETSDGIRSHIVHLNGVCATHAEPDFGPGSITLAWEW